MTEPEANQLADRLRRVWVPKKQIKSQKLFHALIDRRCAIIVTHNPNNNSPSFWLRGLQRHECFRDILGCNQKIGRIICRSENDYQDFVAQYLPFFRERCYLSGADIECSMHEKMEWLQSARESGMLTEGECQELAGRETSCTI